MEKIYRWFELCMYLAEIKKIFLKYMIIKRGMKYNLFYDFKCVYVFQDYDTYVFKMIMGSNSLFK